MSPSRDPPMSAQTYEYLSQLIRQRSHIHLGPNKQSLLTSRLSKHRRDLSLASWEDYAKWLELNPTEGVDTLIDLIATNHTHFFREGVHFEILRDSLLEPLLASCESVQGGLRCWSAACSSGEEPYTLAIVLSEFAQQKQLSLRWHIEATDISYKALSKAKQGVYDMHRLGLPDPVYLTKYFQQGSGPYEGFCKIKEAIQKRVQFSRLNLFADRFAPPGRQHLIFCRNVLIYFELASQAQLIQRLHDSLEPGGYLIVGHSDSLLRIQHPLKGLGNGIYQRTQ